MGTDFLKLILEHKKTEIEASSKKTPEKILREKAEKQRKKISFRQALISPGGSKIKIIAEIKRASPSKGEIKIELDPAVYAKIYEKAGAAAVSVLTDRHFFKGSFDDLLQAKHAVNIPVLRKDFLISSYQIYESAALGADAVLLIARILEKNQLSEYLSLCRELGMDGFVEVHSDKDLENASTSGADIIGINNRDLSSFKTDIQTAIQLRKLFKPNQIPVAASGIESQTDIRKNMENGINCFLIGESIVRAENPEEFIRWLSESKNYEKP